MPSGPVWRDVMAIRMPDRQGQVMAPCAVATRTGCDPPHPPGVGGLMAQTSNSLRVDAITIHNSRINPCPDDFETRAKATESEAGEDLATARNSRPVMGAERHAPFPPP